MVRHEAVQESVPEAAKNMLLVLASSGVLTPQWRVRTGHARDSGVPAANAAAVAAALHSTAVCSEQLAAPVLQTVHR